MLIKRHLSLLLLFSFSLLLGHGFVPHHHHDKQELSHHHHDNDHHTDEGDGDTDWSYLLPHSHPSVYYTDHFTTTHGKEEATSKIKTDRDKWVVPIIHFSFQSLKIPPEPESYSYKAPHSVPPFYTALSLRAPPACV
jgi:hypothetical protein